MEEQSPRISPSAGKTRFSKDDAPVRRDCREEVVAPRRLLSTGSSGPLKASKNRRPCWSGAQPIEIGFGFEVLDAVVNALHLARRGFLRQQQEFLAHFGAGERTCGRAKELADVLGEFAAVFQVEYHGARDIVVIL